MPTAVASRDYQPDKSDLFDLAFAVAKHRYAATTQTHLFEELDYQAEELDEYATTPGERWLASRLREIDADGLMPGEYRDLPWPPGVSPQQSELLGHLAEMSALSEIKEDSDEYIAELRADGSTLGDSEQSGAAWIDEALTRHQQQAFSLVESQPELGEWVQGVPLSAMAQEVLSGETQRERELPSFKDAPVKDAKTVSMKGQPKSMDMREVEGSLPPGVSLGASGYGKKYGRN